MIIQISNRQDDFQIDDELTSDIESSIKICLIQELNDDNYEISLSFVSEEEIKELNRDYRNKDSVTDVLSFPLEDDFQIQTNLLGDIIICCKRAVEQATTILSKGKLCTWLFILCFICWVMIILMKVIKLL